MIFFNSSCQLHPQQMVRFKQGSFFGKAAQCQALPSMLQPRIEQELKRPRDLGSCHHPDAQDGPQGPFSPSPKADDLTDDLTGHCHSVLHQLLQGNAEGT